MATRYDSFSERAHMLGSIGVSTARRAFASIRDVLMASQATWLILAGLVLIVPGRDVYAAGQLIFKSGFAPNVSTKNVYTSAIVDTGLLGLDQETGFTWGNWSSNSLIDNWHFQYVASTPYSDWVATEILGTHAGRSNVLKMEVKGNDPSMQRTRNEMEIRPKSAVAENFQTYTRYWMYLPSNYVQRIDLSKESWHNIFESKQRRLSGSALNNSWRFYIVIYMNGSTPAWRLVKRVANSNTDSEVSDGTISNTKVPVPLGQWFLVEQFFKSHATNGRIWFAVNGKVVFDFNGRTQHPTDPQKVDFYSAFKNYRGDGHAHPYAQYYDDLEVWSDFPPTGSASTKPGVPSGISVSISGTGE